MNSDSPTTTPVEAQSLPCVAAIVPARNEEAAIAACVEALAGQPEIAEIIVVNDQSTDKTAEILRGLVAELPQLRVLETREVPAGWVGKNNAVALGAREAKSPWLLFTDADAELQEGAAGRALRVAREADAVLVSFSPEQITKRWYERALIPFVYLRLAKHFSYEAVNNPTSQAAAANGQFLMMRRDAYDAVGGHAAVAGEVLEDVALARRTKAAGFRLWFGAGQGIVRTRMYRSFAAMWEGWKKNLYLLIGGTPVAVFRELESVIPWIPVMLLLIGMAFPFATFVAVLFLLMRQFIYGGELFRNHYSSRFIIYYVPAVALYTGVLWASYRAYRKGKLVWKGREVHIAVQGTPR
jgi:glycosyltransferase involved in cell wall biosynthesis